MSDACTDDEVRLVAEASGGQTEVLVELIQIGTAHVPQFDAFEVSPDTLIRVEIRGVARQLLKAQSFGSTLGQEVFDGLTAMDRRTIPEHQQLARHLSQQVPQEEHHLWIAEGVILDLQQQAAAGLDAADDRQMVTRERERRVGGWPRGARLRTRAGNR